MIAVETGGAWATAFDIGTLGSTAILDGVSCSDATDCTAVGEDAASHPFYVTETAGMWGSEHEIPITGSTGAAWAVSCSSATSCAAVGNDYQSNEAFYAIETSGAWATPVEVATLGTTGVFFGVSCPDATSCTAVGWDEGTNEPFYDYLTLAGATTTSFARATTTTSTTSTTMPTTTTTLPMSPPPKQQTLNLAVSFPTGSASLSKANQNAIDRFVEKVISAHRHLIYVAGYASPRGTLTENTSLIAERAKVVSNLVRQFLVRQHISGVAVSVERGGIKYLPSQFKDQVATLSA